MEVKFFNLELKRKMEKILNKKFLTISILLIIILVGILLFNNNSTSENNITKPTVTIIVSEDEPNPTSSLQATILNLKFWYYDSTPKVKINLELLSGAKVEEPKGEKTTYIVSIGENKITFNLSHAAVPLEYIANSKVTSNISENLYRVKLEDGTIWYTNDLQNSNCREDVITIKSPCGTPLLNGIEIQCLAEGAIPFCDDIMETVEITNLE